MLRVVADLDAASLADAAGIGGISPAISFSRVVLPTPLAPMIAMRSPA